jgi:4a-hydroxytetrahydrobiopterin dehydratase
MPQPLSREPMNAEEIERRLGSGLEGWSSTEVPGKGRCLEKELRFPDFVEAFSFMAGLALVAERLNHHPEWSNVYNRVQLVLSTHDAGGVTEYDFALAEAAERLARRS